jgi:hypothetical protein
VAQKEEEGVAYPVTESDHEKSMENYCSNAVSGLEVVHGSNAWGSCGWRTGAALERCLRLVDRGGCGVGTGGVAVSGQGRATTLGQGCTTVLVGEAGWAAAGE